MTTAFTNKEPLFSTLWVSGGPTRDPDILKSNNKNKAPMTNIKRDQRGGGRNFHFQLVVMRQCLFYLHIIKKDLFKTNPQYFNKNPRLHPTKNIYNPTQKSLMLGISKTPA